MGRDPFFCYISPRAPRGPLGGGRGGYSRRLPTGMP